MKRIRAAALATVLLASVCQAFGQVVVYDNAPYTKIAFLETGTAGGSGTFGDLVTLGGTARTVTDLVTGISPASEYGVVTADISLSFYARGANDTVGMQIGETTTHHSVTLAPGFNTISFSGLSIDVPNDVIWSVTVKPTTDYGFNVLATDSPSVGSTDMDYCYPWDGFGATPFYAFGPGRGSLLATMTAVPEPGGTFLVFCLVAVGTILMSRRKNWHHQTAHSESSA